MTGAKLLGLVKQLGFPAAVTAWLLYWLPQMNTTLTLILAKLDALLAQLAQLQAPLP